MLNTSVVNVDVVVTDEPFGVSGSISVDDSAFEVSREEFSQGAVEEIDKLGARLLDLALAEYDRRNA